MLGTNPVVEQVSTGGFTVNTDFTPTALRELAKMDGGIVVDDDLTTIISAGVHFSPSASLPTVETGTFGIGPQTASHCNRMCQW